MSKCLLVLKMTELNEIPCQGSVFDLFIQLLRATGHPCQLNGRIYRLRRILL